MKQRPGADCGQKQDPGDGSSLSEGLTPRGPLQKPGFLKGVSDGTAGAALPALEGGRGDYAGDLGVVRASVPVTGIAGVIVEMAACGIWFVSGAGISEQGVGDGELVLPGMG
jgi:hypothetical protein